MSELSAFGPVLVTGASGFVGACVARALLAQGCEVHLLLRSAVPPWRLEDVWDRLTVHHGDLIEAARVRAAVQQARPGVVLHLATHGAYEHQADARAILQTNVVGTYNLLEASAEQGVRIFVNTGSSSEYGFKSEPMCETDRLEPNSFYAVAKAAQTHLCMLLARRTRMAVTVFRLFSVYGPWEEPTRLMPTLIRRARAGLPLEMVSPATVRDFVYIDDVVDALLRFPVLAELRGEVVNLGTGAETSLREVVSIVRELVGSRSEVRWGAMAARHWDASCWLADRARAESLLGWRPRHTLRQGLARMACWMESKGDDYGANKLRSAG